MCGLFPCLYVHCQRVDGLVICTALLFLTTLAPLPFLCSSVDIWVIYSYGLTLSDLAFEDQCFAVKDADCQTDANGNPQPFVANGRSYDFEKQRYILRRAASAWYITLIVTQLFHLLNIKAIHMSIFKHTWSNAVTYYALAVTLALVIIFVYVPGVQVRKKICPCPCAWEVDGVLTVVFS